MSLGLTGKRDIYIEIAEKYERFIRLGVLRDGDKLPSVRIAAGELGVNPNTVQKAYAYLEESGLIRSLPKKGVFVTYKCDGAKKEPQENAKAKKLLLGLKEQGIKYDELIALIKEVYSV